jgi:5-methylcytosine-specific restriction endonuclease McrA
MRSESKGVPTLGQIAALAAQLKLDTSLLFNEIVWALGEERINRVTPTAEQFGEWRRQKDGLVHFWHFANTTLCTCLEQDEVRDIWTCIDLTLNLKTRRGFGFQDYLMIAVRSDQKCQICGRCPPEVRLDIDHILPVSRGGSESHLNLRFLCEHHNRGRGNRFHWADIWRRET